MIVTENLIYAVNIAGTTELILDQNSKNINLNTDGSILSYDFYIDGDQGVFAYIDKRRKLKFVTIDTKSDNIFPGSPNSFADTRDED
jgi:hypothetical protein